MLWALSYFNGAVVLRFLFGRTYSLLPGRSGAVMEAIFGLIGWILERAASSEPLHGQNYRLLRSARNDGA